METADDLPSLFVYKKQLTIYPNGVYDNDYRKKLKCNKIIRGGQAMDGMENICACCHHKNTPRDTKEQKKLQNRINRIIGQLNGIKNMIDDNRYCGDILIQIGAVESALQSLGYVVLEEHMQTCVVEEIGKGNTEIMAEAVELIKKLK